MKREEMTGICPERIHQQVARKLGYITARPLLIIFERSW